MHQFLYFYAFFPWSSFVSFPQTLIRDKDSSSLIGHSRPDCMKWWCKFSLTNMSKPMVCPVCEESMVLWSIDSLFYSILSIDEVSILIISELAGGMVCHCCYLHWLMAFFTSLSTTQFHNKLPSCFQYCITCRQSNKKSKNVSPDTKLLLLCQPGRVGNKADEPLNKWCFIKIHCKKLDNFNFLSILCF